MDLASLVSTLDMGDVRGVIAALTMACYGGIFWWAYHRGNRERFEEDAWLPFADEPVEREEDR